MEQLNNVLPADGEGNRPSEADKVKREENLSLLNKVRQNFGFFGGISLIFGTAFTFLFYRAGIGCNFLMFIVVMICLLKVVSDKLNIPVRKVTKAYYTGAVLLGLSSMLTASIILQLLNIIGILLLFDLSLVGQFNGEEKYDFSVSILRMLRLALKSITAIVMPFIDCNRFLKKVKFLKNDKLRNTLIGVLAAFPLLLIVTALLSSADMIFKKITTKVFNYIFSADLFYIILMVISGIIFCYAVICGAVNSSDAKKREVSKADPQIAVTVITLLFIIYALFCGIQIIYLFNSGLFTLPEGFTYAMYARRGFFELLAVTCFNLVLILACTSLFKESSLLRFLLTATTVTTYIMIASATYRMLLYIGAYHLTFLRLFVLLFLLIDSIVLAGIIIYVYNRSFPLFGFCVAVVTTLYLLFSFCKPDYIIAYYNINHTAMTKNADVYYLTKELSYDAAPVVVPYLNKVLNTEADKRNETAANEDYENSFELQKSYYLAVHNSTKERDFRDFNISMSIASWYISQYPVKFSIIR